MEIGKPRRVYRVEPVRDPVPVREEPRKAPPAPKRKEPSTAPAR